MPYDVELGDLTASASSAAPASHLVARNTLYLTIAQALAMPLSIVSNAVAAHYLGAEAFGYIYLAGTLCGFGFLAVGWGHEAVLPAQVARDHSLAGRMLGSSLAWRAATAIVVYAILAFGCYLLDYPSEFQWALGLTSLFTTLTHFVAACKDTIRGLERTDIPAFAHFGQLLLNTVLVVIVLMLGGRLRSSLLANAAACAITLAAVWSTLGRVGVGVLSIRWTTIKTLFSEGTPFVVFGVALALQPNIDAVFLSKLSPPEVMGWYAVSRRLVGALLLPATALIGALYPTLCRLYSTDLNEFTQTSNGALRNVTLAVVPIALGCALFPEIGVALFSRESFGPAEDNLRIMAVMLALLYFTMPLGICIVAAGKQRAWSLVQCACIGVSLILDPWLVPMFQRWYGNGGLGLCIASVVSEVIMIAFGMSLAPRGVFDRRLRRVILLALISGAAMMLTAQVSKPLGPLVAAPLSVLAYGGSLWLTGGIDNRHVTTLRSAARSFLPRR